ncbi:serine hydrolase domain-containing protein [Paenibacillus macquariensis]|uniref:CubicO group peptidase, beta-lactamase class C family n=1 Tax=Paenibacillus macquariensis TaxID=948756 RepID=A0ABY1K2R3_9BACL|nr:serine hydrolase domain-containing protein [Paenibacillus macquariensis]MEC0090236.1 serine hydrolase [Paenibacillus macquariensis]OAB39599.1 serine hydrolase [Paenibacillus macquariensis subsp. macquariensis]SIR17883.1 CubicO group peptidase, beta-lactamase class C family [Paenibacillus macquariensis]
MKRMFSVVMTAMLIAIPVTPAFAQPNNDTAKEKAQVLATTMVSDYGVSGLQYAIMDKGSIVLSDNAGVYDKASNAPITKDTMFGIGSLSKMYVSAATMMLAESKKVDIDKPLTTYIKDFTMADERYKEITPRMLMNHSSGLYGTHFPNSLLFDDNDTKVHDELLFWLQSEKLKSNPGEYSVYSNDGFDLLEIMIERVSGISYTEFLAKYVSTPLNLSSTKTPLDHFERERLAKTYFPTIDQALPIEYTNTIGSGGIYSTAEELTKFAEILIGNRTDVLSKQSAKDMQSPEYKKGIWVSEETNTFNYGLGWDSVSLAPFDNYGITALFKGGDTSSYHGSLISIPEYNISMAVLSSGGTSFFDLTFASNVLLEYLRDKGHIKEILPEKTFKPSLKVKMPSELLSYAGLYGSVGSTINMEIKNGEIDLPAQLGGLIPAQKYVYTGDGQFKNSDGSIAVSFDKQTNGKTYVKLNAYTNFPGLGQFMMVIYAYQKLDPNPLNHTTKKVWENRNGKNYYALDEKITSGYYLFPTVLNKNISVDMDHGYANGTKIVDGNKAVNAVEIPVMMGRDAFDLNFYKVGHTEYLKIDGTSYISEDAVKAIYGGKSSTTTIQSKGQAVWYKIDENSANRVMTVEAQASGGFAVYDAKGMAVDFSKASNNHSVVLPEGGMIVFGGNEGDVFKINMKNK